jgi:REP element-mobilizing transposase RayT
MARLARVVIPGHPHHVTQRGNGRARTFFEDADYTLYRNLLAEHCRAAEVEVWGWCLMPNHVHLILVPSDPDGLRRALARVHRAYAGAIQARRKRSGHFWQGRFGAVAMDEEYWRRRYATCRSIRCGRGWSIVRRIGGGRVCARICAARTTGSPRLHRSGIASPTSPICSPANRRRIYSDACVPPRALAGRSATIALSPASSDGPGACSNRVSVGRRALWLNRELY